MAVPEIERSEYFFRLGRDTAKAKVDELRSPIARPSSIPNRYAVSYYDREGKFVHSLFDAYRVLTRRGDIDVITIGEGNSRMEFETPKAFIDYIRAINPGVYGGSVEENPTLVNSNGEARGGGRGFRRRGGRAKTLAQSRKKRGNIRKTTRRVYTARSK